jgi:hypothetical protein
MHSPLISNLMPELTLEAIEQMLDKKFDEKLAPLATRGDVREAVDELAGIIADTIATPFTKRFDRLEELLEVKEDVLTLKQQMREIRSALHLSA